MKPPRAQRMGFLGSDTGGTFTDLVWADATGIRSLKIPALRADPAASMAEGIAAFPSPTLFAHATTLATNIVLERRGARVVFVATRGFGDLLTIGRQTRPSLYSSEHRPPPVVPRDQVVEVTERVGPLGEVLTELTDAETDRVVTEIEHLRPDAVAITLLFSFLRPEHEERLAGAVAKRLPAVPVSRSSYVLPEVREYERASTTSLDAYVAPRIREHVARLRKLLPSTPMLLMQSHGGVVAPEVAVRRPSALLMSGPAAGVAAARELGRRIGAENLLTFDMGGTSTDVAAIVDGEARTTADGIIEGLPVGLSMVDIVSVGAGGGSIVWIDDGGALRVGPRSAGADPGPACFGRGGREITITDVDLLRGVIDPGFFAGGRLALDPAAARAVLDTVAEGAGLAAESILAGATQVVEANMARALRKVSTQRGLDPKRFALLAFGGAGPIHAVAVARELEIPEVLVPPLPGVFSAWGLLVTDIRLTLGASRLIPLPATAANLAVLEQTWRKLDSEAASDLRSHVVTLGEADRRYALDIRYTGQTSALTVELRPDGALDQRVAKAANVFHRRHGEVYGHQAPGEPVEIVAVRLSVTASRDRPAVPPPLAIGPALSTGTRDVEIGTQRLPVRTYRRSGLPATEEIAGPAIIVDDGATVLVPPDVTWYQDGHAVLHLRLIDTSPRKATPDEVGAWRATR